MCDPVWYTVTISTGGMVIITDNTTLTNYTVTGLNDNTAYHVSVTANNNAGSSNATSMMTMTNSNGKFDMHLYTHIRRYVHVCIVMVSLSGLWILINPLLLNYVNICVNLASLVYALHMDSVYHTYISQLVNNHIKA